VEVDPAVWHNRPATLPGSGDNFLPGIYDLDSQGGVLSKIWEGVLDQGGKNSLKATTVAYLETRKLPESRATMTWLTWETRALINPKRLSRFFPPGFAGG
jgi:hypothetical protein